MKLLKRCCFQVIRTGMMSFVLFGLFFSPVLAEPTDQPIRSQSELIKAGGIIAQKQCQECHAIGKTGKSTHKEAPPFRSFSKKWPVEMLEESLAEGIMTGHKDMPEIQMSPDEINAFIAYLKSLEG